MQNRQIIMVEITHANALRALHNLQGKHLIRIVEDKIIDSPSLLTGKQLSINAFRSWISVAENMNTVALNAAKSKWTSRRKQMGVAKTSHREKHV